MKKQGTFIGDNVPCFYVLRFGVKERGNMQFFLSVASTFELCNNNTNSRDFFQQISHSQCDSVDCKRHKQSPLPSKRCEESFEKAENDHMHQIYSKTAAGQGF